MRHFISFITDIQNSNLHNIWEKKKLLHIIINIIEYSTLNCIQKEKKTIHNSMIKNQINQKKKKDIGIYRNLTELLTILYHTLYDLIYMSY